LNFKEQKIAMNTITFFQNITFKIEDQKPYYAELNVALDRIKNGAIKNKIEELRLATNEIRINELKKSLPAVMFSGKFAGRKDADLVEHSGFIVLDFDKVFDVDIYKKTLIENYDFIYACWVSPRGNGVKALVKIADTQKHKEHFKALCEDFPDLDRSGANVSRLCFESYDPDIVINAMSKTYSKKISDDINVIRKEARFTDNEIFRNLLTWQKNKGNAFVSGNRNQFIFDLAGGCCRYGMPQEVAIAEILSEFPTDSGFTDNEAKGAIRSAYKIFANLFGSAVFEKEKLVDKTTKIEVESHVEEFEDGKITDIAYIDDFYDELLDIHLNGYKAIQGIGVPELDEIYKMRKKDLTLFSGYANHGKSTFLLWMLIMRSIRYQDKWVMFVPESSEADFFAEVASIYLGTQFPKSILKKDTYEVRSALKWVGEYFKPVYIKNDDPSPDRIKAVFLKAILDLKCSGVIIDPFNQMYNDLAKYGNSGYLYLSKTLRDFKQFALENNVFFVIVAHPSQPREKGADGNYRMPTEYEIADGSMWNNKVDNMLMVHRPYRSTDPNNPVVQVSTKKIKKMRVVGKLDTITLEYDWKTSRFWFTTPAGNIYDPMQELIDSMA
jgi:hypothetical protein